jgi:hypothetical protein
MSNTNHARILGGIRSAGNDIKQASAQLLQRTEAIPSALGEISQRIDQAINRPAVAGTSSEDQNRASSRLDEAVPPRMEVRDFDKLGKSTAGALVALYCCILSFEKQKSIIVEKIFPGNAQVSQYTQGVIAGIRAFDVMEINLVDKNFSIIKINEKLTKEIRERVEQNMNMAYVKQYKAEIDTYFEGELA